jgi:hypothetical protein
MSRLLIVLMLAMNTSCLSYVQNEIDEGKIREGMSRDELNVALAWVVSPISWYDGEFKPEQGLEIVRTGDRKHFFILRDVTKSASFFSIGDGVLDSWHRSYGEALRHIERNRQRYSRSPGYVAVQQTTSTSSNSQTVLAPAPSRPTSSPTAAELDAWRNLCFSYGFQAGTDALAECVQRENQGRIATQSATPASNSNVDASQQEQAIARQRRADINFCKAAMFSRPTRTGDFSESAMLALQCNSNPRAHLSQPAPNYRCRADFTGTLTCEAY